MLCLNFTENNDEVRFEVFVFKFVKCEIFLHETQ